MRIAMLGAGAMGGLFGAYLSQKNDVTMVDVSAEVVSAINEKGLEVREPDGSAKVYHPAAVTSATAEAAARFPFCSFFSFPDMRNTSYVSVGADSGSARNSLANLPARYRIKTQMLVSSASKNQPRG